MFISYRHGDPWTRIARKFHNHLLPISGPLGFTLFLDDSDIQAADRFETIIKNNLDKTSHFIVLLCDDYWLSEWCRKELDYAVRRYQETGTPRLLFVLAEAMNPHYLIFDAAHPTGTLRDADGGESQLSRVSDLLFLGPFDPNLRLVRLDLENPVRLADQIHEMSVRLQRTLPAQAGN
ncbi:MULTISPECIES: toll/interleukin-1 receptor domain-containing protein [Paraburkholderia]|uniref:toll/interleukin-1 receptor domain-containing protein n=1 Tax=Paraburkholderia TaxID=1822464 RepID=UPI001359A1E6|nr:MULTISPECIES: toll/interleukin-1 receptor domain-containing protein [Paraburkholderia]